jgi:hypothetical protein
VTPEFPRSCLSGELGSLQRENMAMLPLEPDTSRSVCPIVSRQLRLCRQGVGSRQNLCEEKEARKRLDVPGQVGPIERLSCAYCSLYAGLSRMFLGRNACGEYSLHRSCRTRAPRLVASAIRCRTRKGTEQAVFSSRFAKARSILALSLGLGRIARCGAAQLHGSPRPCVR